MSELLTNCNNKCPFYSNDTCLKPNGFVCPSISIGVHNERSIIVKEDNISYLTKRCAICENDIKFIGNSDEIICSECKEAIKKLKEMLNNADR